MSVKVCKFGGTSLADAAQICKVKAIIKSDPQRRYVVVSAPGKRSRDDQKITDLLYLCHEHARQRLPFDEVFDRVADRYRQIITDLGLSLDINPRLEQVKQEISQMSPGEPDGAVVARGGDYAASRGEYLNAPIVAELLGYTFVDAAELICFDASGRFDPGKTQEKTSEHLSRVERAVIPGFYGTTPDGKIKTFSRGGSDITGAIIARGVNAAVYENWTDVSGLLMTDPRIVENPKPIDTITYRELRELAYMGATVLHDEAIFPVRTAGIPVNIRNTDRPEDPGTMIVSEAEPIAHQGTISGIAGRKDFSVLAIEKTLMNQELGFGRRLLTILEDNGISFEHMPSGIDTMSVVIADRQLEGKLDKIRDEIRRHCEPDSLEVYPHMALIATVGRGMAYAPGIAARVFTALARAGVNIRMIDQGSSEINIIVGVETGDFEKAVCAIYDEFIEPDR